MCEKVSKKKPKIPLFDIKLAKFLLVGIATTVIGAGLMFLLYNIAGVSYWISSACNYVIGGVLSYFLNKYFTFQNMQKGLKQIFYFILNLVSCYFIAYFVAKKAVYHILSAQSEKNRDNVALFTGMCIYTILNYLGQRLIVFNSQENINENEVEK